MLTTISGVPAHGLFVGLGVLAAVVVFVSEARRRGHTDDRLLIVVTGALVGGALLMRLGTWLQHVDLRAQRLLRRAVGLRQPQHPGGLVGAWLGVHVAKRLCGYRLRTGDLFAPAVALGMAVGRIGCLLTELPGTPTGASWGISLDRADAARLGAPAGRAAAPVVRLRDRLPPRRVRRDLVLAAPPAHAAGRGRSSVRRGVRRVPVPGRVRARQRGRLGGPDPSPAVPAATIPLLLLRIVLRARSGAYSPVRPMVDDPEERVHQ